MKKILLVRTFRMLASGGPVPPLGLLYMSAMVKRHFPQEFEVRLWDTGVQGEDVELFASFLEEFPPDYVGFSTLSPEVDLLLTLARAVKVKNKGSFALVGGPHATSVKEKLLQHQEIDALIIGEGEEAFVETLRALIDKADLAMIKGLMSRRSGGGFAYQERPALQNLDGIPFPDWDLIDPADYASILNWNGPLKRKAYMPIVTSRGCPYSCVYCHAIFGKRFRARSASNVLLEINTLYERGIREFHIADDIFNFDLARAKEICRMIIDSGRKISLAFPNGLRADAMDEELVILLRQAGTYKIHFAFESGSERIRDMIDKRLDVNKTISIVRRASDMGILTADYFMMGFPTETKEEMLATIRLAVESPLDIAYFFKAIPYDGTSLCRMVSGDGLPYEHQHFFDTTASYAAVSPEELNSMLLSAQQKFFLNGKRLWSLFRKSPRKGRVCGDLLRMMALMCQGYLIRELKGGLI